MSQSRQLDAIMFTDIVGYTDLMAKDRDKTMELLRLNKEIQNPLVESHQGRLLKELGDGTMSTFQTASDAIDCALALQKQTAEVENLTLRIGIHLGEVVIEENDAFGDGVNIASRIQSIADPGGIYISESIHKAIRGRSDIQAQYLGETQLKNVDYPVKIYALQGVGLPVPEVKEDKELSGRIWAEVQRRGIIRAAISYMVVALLLVLIWDKVQDVGVALPGWSFTLLLATLGIGFLFALYLAWNYERSPEGFIKTTSQQSWQNPLKSSQRKPLTGTLFVLGLLLVAGFLYLYPKKSSPNQIQETAESSFTPMTIEKSIAVLPFDNFSQKKEENQYLCDGFMEEIINQLSKIKTLQVRSRSSVEQYRENRPTSPEIAQKLHVSHLLEGSVQRIGDELKVVVQLIDASEDRHVWQESYEQPLEDIFQMQSNIAQRVARELQIALSPEEKNLIDTAPTENLKAYDFFLRAQQNQRNWIDNRNRMSYENAIILYQSAEREDPTFAMALRERAQTYWHGTHSEELRQEIVWILDSVLILCNRALAIDPDLNSAYRTRARYYNTIGEYDKARSDAEKAWQLNPNDTWNNHLLGFEHFRARNYIHGLQLMHRGEKLGLGDIDLIWIYHRLYFVYLELFDNEKALHYLDQASSIQPNFKLDDKIALAQNLKQWDKAYKLLQTYISLNPPNRLTLELQGSYYLLTQDNERALDLFEKALTLSYQGQDYYDWVFKNNCYRGMALWLADREAEGEKLLNETLTNYLNLDRLTESDREVRIAAIHAFLGNKQEAYSWLRKSTWTNTALYEVQQDLWFSSISGEKEFQDLVNAAKEEKRTIREEIARLKVEGDWEI